MVVAVSGIQAVAVVSDYLLGPGGIILPLLERKR